MRIAAACVMVAASLTAIVKHTERPPAASAPLVDRSLPARASRGLQRHPLPRRVNTALASVKASHDPRAFRHVGHAAEDDLRGAVTVLNWHALAECESSDNPRTNTGNGYYGLYQFALSTWESVGGSGLPSSASPQEQTYRAELLYRRRGRAPWPVCGRWL